MSRACSGFDEQFNFNTSYFVLKLCPQRHTCQARDLCTGPTVTNVNMDTVHHLPLQDFLCVKLF